MLAEGTPARDRGKPDRAGGLSGESRMSALTSRGAEHLLRQKPHPARCRPDRRRGPDHHIAWPQWRRQDHHAAQPGRPDPATLRPRDVVRQGHHRPAAVPHRRGRRRLRPGRPPGLRQPDGGRKPSRPDRAARSLRYRPGLPAVPPSGRAQAEPRPAIVRRRAGDAVDRPGPAAEPATADPGRAQPGAGAVDRQGGVPYRRADARPRGSPSCWWSRTCA